jgi:NAD(P)-dependent dehydrogenase (short-subunit alcohol dehydrogenase family)
MDYGLEGKVALVTGAASGIGRATAALLARSGARVVASDLRAGDGVVAADVTDGEAMRAVVARAVETYGRLDLAANCAGVGGGHGATHEYPEAEFDRIVAINLRGTWLSMRAELEAMLRAGGGAIVNVSSTLGLRGSPFAAPYSASKHGVLGLTKTAALEYAQQGIRVNAVCPGAIDTPMMDETFERFPGFRETLTAYVPMGRMGGPEEVAGAIAWLCSDAASFVTGEALTVEGGLLSR